MTSIPPISATDIGHANQYSLQSKTEEVVVTETKQTKPTNQPFDYFLNDIYSKLHLHPYNQVCMFCMLTINSKKAFQKNEIYKGEKYNKEFKKSTDKTQNASDFIFSSIKC